MNVSGKIAKPKGVTLLVKKNGTTKDIMNTILWADYQPEHRDSLKQFAELLRGKNTLETAYNVWKWVKENIHYVLDPEGKQIIKSPAQTWLDGFSDCKSRSLFVSSLLKNLKIPYGYRFASYTGTYPYTHIYVLAYINNKIYKIDVDMVGFDMEQKTSYFKDYNMTQIAYVSGVKALPRKLQKLVKKPVCTPKVGELDIYRPLEEMTDFDMKLAILKQRDEIQRQKVEKIAGIGCPHAQPITKRINTYNKIIELRKSNLPEQAKLMGIGYVVQDHFDENYTSISGIGILKKLRTKVKTVTNKVAKKVVDVAKKAGKAVLKVATAPQRLVVKGILEVSLPSAAPFFLYLFITNKQTIESLPPKARAKRKKSENIAKFITNVIGMKSDHLMGILRNGIMKKYGKSPEQVLSGMVKGSINGIGIAPIIAAAVPVVKKIIETLIKVFKKKGENMSLSENDAPSPDDFNDSSPAEQQQFAKSIRNSENSNVMYPADNSGGTSYDTEKDNSNSSLTNTNTRKSGIC